MPSQRESQYSMRAREIVLGFRGEDSQQQAIDVGCAARIVSTEIIFSTAFRPDRPRSGDRDVLRFAV